METTLLEASVLPVECQVVYGSAALCFQFFLLFLLLLSFPKPFVDFQPAYYQEGEKAENQ